MQVVVARTLAGMDCAAKEKDFFSAIKLGLPYHRMCCTLPGFHLEILSTGGKSGDRRIKGGQQLFMDLPLCTLMFTEYEVCTYKYMYTVGKTCDLYVQKGVGAEGGCAPSSAEREAKLM